MFCSHCGASLPENCTVCTVHSCPSNDRASWVWMHVNNITYISTRNKEPLRNLIDSGIVMDPVDLYRIHKNDFLEAGGSSKDFDYFKGQLDLSKSCSLRKFVASLFIPSITTSYDVRAITQLAGSVYGLIGMDEDTLGQYLGSPEKAREVVRFFDREDIVDLLINLDAIGINPVDLSKKYRGKSICFAGKSQCCRRIDEMEPYLRSMGATLHTNVEPSTDFLVLARDYGYKKLNDARQNGHTTCIQERTFWSEIGMMQ